MKNNKLSLILALILSLTCLCGAHAENIEATEYGKIFMVEDYSDGEIQLWGGALNGCYVYNSNGSFYENDYEHALIPGTCSLRWDNMTEKTTVSGTERNRTGMFARVNRGSKSEDFRDYEYVNAWVWSDEATVSDAIFLNMYYDPINDIEKNPQEKTAGYHYLKSPKITVNWSGWKLISFKISELTDNMAEQYNGNYSWNNGDMKINAVGFKVWNSNDSSTFDELKLNIDSIWVSQYDPLEFDINAFSSDRIDNLKDASDVPITNQSVIISFNRELNPIDIDKRVHVFINDEPAECGNDFGLKIMNNKIYLDFIEPLLPLTQYCLKIDSTILSSERVELGKTEEISFTTGRKECYVKSLIFTHNEEEINELPESGVVCAQATVFNMTDKEQSVAFILADYKKETNYMLEFKTISQIVAPDSETIFTLAVSSDDFSENIVEAFCIDDISSLYNYNEVVFIE